MKFYEIWTWNFTEQLLYQVVHYALVQKFLAKFDNNYFLYKFDNNIEYKFDNNNFKLSAVVNGWQKLSNLIKLSQILSKF